MKKGQILSGKVIRLDFPNKGIIETEEGLCVVKNVLPGQRITFVIYKMKKGKPEGRLLSIEEKSCLEMDSPCPHFGACGGCSLLTLPYEEQLRIKEEQVRRLLEPVLGRQQEPELGRKQSQELGRQQNLGLGIQQEPELGTQQESELGGQQELDLGRQQNPGLRKQLADCRWEGIKGSPRQYAYRNKMEFSFGDEQKGGPLSLGMHRRGGFYDVVSVDGCQIVDEDYRRILVFTRDYFASVGYPFFHRLRHEGYLRHLLIRKAVRTQEILVALVTTSQAEGDLSAWLEGILELPLEGKIRGVLHIMNDSVADVVQSDRTEILYGQDWFYEEILDLRFKISTFSFFQTNSLGAEVLYGTVRDFIGEMEEGNGRKPVIYDLYCGTGTIAQMMAPVASKVIGVEIVEEAVIAARENAEANGIHNCEFVAGDVLKVLDDIEEEPDFIILDPPRDGVNPKALKKIIDYGVRRLLYISCKPTSLFRDLEELLDAGYVVVRWGAVDMFPGTTNVETVALLERKG